MDGGEVGLATRVSVAEYSSEFATGPMVGGTFVPDNSTFRVYELFSDSLSGNSNQDYLDWPVSQGAPVDDQGHPVMLGYQMLWSVYNDADASTHTNPAGGSSPLGIEVQQTVWAYHSVSPALQRTVYIKYKFYNRGSNSISNFRVSFWADPDLGGASDDLVGCDTVNQIFFAYNGTNSDSRYGIQPPAWGGKLLAGLVVPSVGDTAYFDGRILLNYRNLPMSAFCKYINGTDPRSSAQSFNYMQGLNANGTEYTYNGHATLFAVSGDPVAGTGDLDFTPSDRRFMMTCGPVSFLPGDSQQMVLAFAVGQGPDRLTSVTDLNYVLNNVQLPVGVAESKPQLPHCGALSQNYPNPFNLSTSIQFNLPRTAHASLDVFNITGQKVVTLVDERLTAGSHVVSWDGRNAAGKVAASGTYFYRLKSLDLVESRKMVLLK